MDSVQKAIRVVITPGIQQNTLMRDAPFIVQSIDGRGVVLLLGKKRAATRFSWECLEGIAPLLRCERGTGIAFGTYMQEARSATCRRARIDVIVGLDAAACDLVFRIPEGHTLARRRACDAIILNMAAMPFEEIRRLPLEERLRIVEDIWESIREEGDALPLTSAQRDELQRRLAGHRADPSAGDDLATVMRRIRSGG